MRVRQFEVRLIAGSLAIGWALAAGLILLGYRPGGPVDLLVGLVAGLPILVAVVALAWPPVTRDDSVFAAIVWLGIGAALLLVPSIVGLVRQLQAGGPQTLLPSLETGYAWFLALLATSVFAGLGVVAHRFGSSLPRRLRVVRAVTLGLGTSIVVAAVFAGVAVANELGVREGAVAASRFGPTDPDAEPPLCADPVTVGPGALVDASFDADVDGHSIGTIELGGVRSGRDFRWLAYVATNLELGQHGWARVGDGAWSFVPGRGWLPARGSAVAGGALDAAVLDVALVPDVRTAAEVLGVDVFEGAVARHCRIAIDGPAFLAAFPQARWLLGDADVSLWRGELDFWVFTDGQLGRVAARLNGHDGELGIGLQTNIRVTLAATDRTRPHRVVTP